MSSTHLKGTGRSKGRERVRVRVGFGLGLGLGLGLGRDGGAHIVYVIFGLGLPPVRALGLG